MKLPAPLDQFDLELVIGRICPVRIASTMRAAMVMPLGCMSS